MPVVEIVKWRSQNDVKDDDMIAAVNGILPDLKTLPGFIDQTLYKDSSECWVDIYHWQTEEEGIASNDLMADKPAFIKLMSLIDLESVSIEFMYPASPS